MLAPGGVGPWAALVIVISAGGLAALLIALTRPFLLRHALARPNERSSHTIPTPQGGGVGVIGATAIVMMAGAVCLPVQAPALQLALVLAATIALAMLGLLDDLWSLPVLPRLAVHFLAAMAIVAALPADLGIVPFAPFWLDRAIAIVALVWFVNLTNFMDGLDWMTVAEVVPLTAALALAGWLGALPDYAVLTALALLGAMLGFAPFNRPVARLFLGDVGSLPIGALLGWLLLLLAGAGHPVAALLLPLYYLADASLTLIQRKLRGERISEAHRSHYYQRATARGRSVLNIVGTVFLTNVVLAGLALASIAIDSAVADSLLGAAGLVAVATTLVLFTNPANQINQGR